MVYVSNAIKRLQIDICGLSLSMDEGYWRIHPDHKDIVEIFVDRAYQNLHSRIKDFGHLTPLTVNVILYGVERSLKRIGGA